MTPHGLYVMTLHTETPGPATHGSKGPEVPWGLSDQWGLSEGKCPAASGARPVTQPDQRPRVGARCPLSITAG